MKILIADDNATSRLLLTSTLATLGHEVLAAANGRQAWDRFQTGDCQLVISDWLMPEIDGLQLCRLIRAEKRQKYTYIILLTMMEGKGAFLEGMRAGADDFITKPFDEDQLAARLRVAERILSLQWQVKQLEKLLPICSYCRTIRDEHNEWQSLEDYISTRTEMTFSHSICPNCYRAHVEPELTRLGIPTDTKSVFKS